MTNETNKTNETNETKKTTRRKAAAKLPAVQSPIEQSMSLMEIAVKRGASPEEIKALMDMRRELQAEYAANQFRESKAKFLTALPIIKKRKTASFATKNGGVMTYNYASLEDIVETVKPYLDEHGFSYQWIEQITEGNVTVTCVLTHKEGHCDKCTMTGMLDNSGGKNPIQMLASSSTYLRRYTLTGVMGIATADEDIDGRLPEQVRAGSRTLEGILNDGEEEAQAICDAIVAADNLEELNKAGSAIKNMPDGKFKEQCKKEYYEARKIMEAAKDE